MGTMAMSSNNSIDRAALPTGDLVPEIGSTSAVEDKASARPRPSAPLQYWPITISAKAMRAADMVSSSAPSPNTSRRIDHNRLKLSSSPMVNSSRMIPNSAKGSSPCGSVIVTYCSQG